MQPSSDLSVESHSNNPSQQIDEQGRGKGKLSGRNIKIARDKKSRRLSSQDMRVTRDGEDYEKLSNQDVKKLRRLSLSPRKAPVLISSKKEDEEKQAEMTEKKSKRLPSPQSQSLRARVLLTHQDSTVLFKQRRSPHIQSAKAVFQLSPSSAATPTISSTSSLSYTPLISSLTDQKLVILKDKYDKLVEKKKRRKSSSASSSESEKQKESAPKQAIKMLDTALAKLKEDGAEVAAETLCQHPQFHQFHRFIFAELLNQLDADSSEKLRQELTHFIFAILTKAKRHDLYECHDILKKIALKSWDLYVPLTLHLEDYYAKEMVELILTQPHMHKTILFGISICSALSLDQLICILCLTYKGLEDSKQKENVIAFLHSLFKVSFISLSQESSFHILKFAQDEHSKPQLISPLLKEVLQQAAALISDKYEEHSFKEKEGELKEKQELCPLKAIRTAMDKRDLSSHFLKEIALDLKSYLALSFCQISSLDLINQNWNKNPTIALHIIDFTQKMNAITQWAAHCIVKPATPEQRANRCLFFIELAWQSAQIGDFNTAMALYLSLISCSVRRLSKTWEHVHSKAMQTYQALVDLFNLSNNFDNYRKKFQNWWKQPEHQDKTQETCPIPLLACSLKDLTFIYDGNLDLKEGKLNEEKLQLLASFYESLLTYQADLHCAHDALLNRKWNSDMIEKIEAFKLKMTSKAEIEKLDDELFERSKRREA